VAARDGAVAEPLWSAALCAAFHEPAPSQSGAERRTPKAAGAATGALMQAATDAAPETQPDCPAGGRVRRVSQFLRYLVTGGVNTAFGYGVYAGLTWLLTDRLRGAYMVAAVASNILAITFSYATYKVFVFKTRGHYLREYLRTYLVYGGVTLLGLALLPLLVEVLGVNAYLAALLLIPVTVLCSFLGHKHFSFRSAAVSRLAS